MKILSITLAVCFAIISTSVLAEKPHGPKPVEVNVTLGTEDNQMVFVPNTLNFERGNYYKLAISNPSKEDHYFASDAFATHIFTRKVEVLDKEGKTLSEIHGPVTGVELKPGASVEWFFYPMTNGDNLKLYCHKEGHEEQGMVGTISITGELK